MIDSIVFKFINGKNIYNAQIIDPLFKEIQKSNLDKEDRKSNDTYQIILLDIIEFLSTLNIKDISIDGKTSDQRYLNLMCIIFNKYIAQNGYKYAGIDFQTPHFAKADIFQLNLNFIEDKTTKTILKNETMHDLFKIMLSSFKKNRKSSTNLLSEEIVKIINMHIDTIKDKINVVPTENEVLDFKTFLKKSTIENEDSNVFENQTNEALSLKEKNPGKEKVNIFVGRFQPFTLGHIKVLEAIYKKNNLPVVVMIVRGSKPDPERRPFDEKLQMKMFKGMQKEYKFLKDAFIVSSAAPDVLFNSLRPTYEPVLWGAGTDRIKSYQGMIDRYRKELNAGDDFNTFEIHRTDENISASKVRDAIKNNNLDNFKEWTPKGVWSLFDEMHKILKFTNVEESYNFKVKSFLEFINEDISTEVERINTAIASVKVIDKKHEEIITTKLQSTADYIENFKSISDIHDVFVVEKGFSEDDYESIVKILQKDNEQSLDNFSEYLKHPHKVDYFMKYNTPGNLTVKMSKEIGVSESTLRHLFNMDGQMKSGKGVGRGELFLGLMIENASNASIGDVNVNGEPYEVKARFARLNTQNGFGNGNNAIRDFVKQLGKINPELAFKYAIKDKKDVSDFNLRKKTQSKLLSILKESGKDLAEVIKIAADSIFTGNTGIWPESNMFIKNKVIDSLKIYAKNNDTEWFNYAMMYNNILYYQLQEHFNGIFLINNNNGIFGYFNPQKEDEKWLAKNTKFQTPSFQDNPTSNCWKITLK
jgi:cytidyltransferase-like protein